MCGHLNALNCVDVSIDVCRRRDCVVSCWKHTCVYDRAPDSVLGHAAACHLFCLYKHTNTTHKSMVDMHFHSVTCASGNAPGSSK